MSWGAVFLALWLAGPIPQVEVGDRLNELEEENRELRRDLETVQRQIFELLEGGGQRPGEATERGGLQGEYDRETERRTKGGLFSKPFLGDLSMRSYLGGYVDLEYRDEEGENRTFRQHRFIPFIYSQVTDQIRFAAEIEFEDGGTDSPDPGETKVEFATLDYQLAESFGIRAGAILAPLGKFNLAHDSPVNDLTDRPLVNRFIIPTTLTEAGIGIFGTVYPSEESKLDYELYAVNGFRGLVEDSTTPTGYRSNFGSSGFRGGRGSLRADNNNSIAGVGRVSFSPFVGCEVGASAHAGRYDDKGDNSLVIWALDAIYSPFAALEFQGEVARGDLSRDSLAKASGVPDDSWGFYTQANYHFMFSFLEEKLPELFREDSIFTAVARLGHVEVGSTRTERVTLGFNFRPIEGTVFKFDYQFNFEDWSRREIRNDAFLFSVASYF